MFKRYVIMLHYVACLLMSKKAGNNYFTSHIMCVCVCACACALVTECLLMENMCVQSNYT